MWFWIGLVAGVLPFFIKVSRRSIEEENGQAVAFSYFDFVAIAGGIVAMAGAVALLEANTLGIAKSGLLLCLALLQIARGVALGTRLHLFAMQRQQRKQQNDLPDKIEVPGMGVGNAEDVIRMPSGARFSYLIQRRFMGTTPPEEDFLSQVPDHILNDEELQELFFGVYHWRLSLMLLAAERGIDLDTLYEVYKRMAKVYAEHKGLDPRVPAQTILNSNALEYLLRRKVTPNAILEVFRRFPEIASHREIIRQSASGSLHTKEKRKLNQQQKSKLKEIHEFLLDLLEEQRFGDDANHIKLAATLAANTQAYEHAITLHKCGYILFERWQLSYAEPMLRKAASLAHLALDQELDEDPELFLAYFKSEYSLAKIYLELGDLQQAINRIQKGMAQSRNLAHQVHISEDMDKRLQRLIMFALEVAAEVYHAVGYGKIAQSLARAALYHAWDIYGEEHSYPSRVQILLATIYRDSGFHELSRKHFENALPHAELHPAVQLRWASYLIFDHEFDRAKQLLDSVVDSEVFQANAHLRADWAAMLGEIAVGKSNFKEALTWKVEAVKLSDKFLEEQSARLSNVQFRQYCAGLFRYVYELVDFVQQHKSDQPEAVRVACDAMLRRKLIESDVLRYIHHVASIDPKYRESYQQLSRLRSQIGAARLIEYAALKHDKDLVESIAMKERLEADLAIAVGGFRFSATSSVEIEAKLPQDTALVEYLCLPWFPAAPGDDEKQPARYVAFIIRRDRPCELVNIGPAPAIDSAIADYQRTMTQGGRDIDGEHEGGVSQVTGVGLREMIFDPITQKIQGCSKLVVAPDGELCRVSIGALPDGDAYLIDKCQISYVSTGRDMLRPGRERGAKHTPPVVMADPDYDFGMSKDTKRIFIRLSGARDEGYEIAKLLGVEAVVDADATEELLKGLNSPAILHIATHAYFQDKSVDKFPKGTYRPAAEVITTGLRGGGLALAGANTWLANRSIEQGTNEGLVNADDVMEIDLSGTQLAVLSACETALGEVHIGQGVMGLQRSFVVAGVDTLVMSLWRVPDKETSELMKVFYREILKGKGCGEALVTAQQKFSHRDVYFWGAFICQGNTDPISSEVIAEIQQRVENRSRASRGL